MGINTIQQTCDQMDRFSIILIGYWYLRMYGRELSRQTISSSSN